MNKQIEVNTNCGNAKAMTTDQLWMLNELKEACESGSLFKAQILETRLKNLGVNVEVVSDQ